MFVDIDNVTRSRRGGTGGGGHPGDQQQGYQRASGAAERASRPGVVSQGYVVEVGRVVAQGTVEELSSSDIVRKAYLGGQGRCVAGLKSLWDA